MALSSLVLRSDGKRDHVSNLRPVLPVLVAGGRLHDDQGQVFLRQRDDGGVRPVHEPLVHHLHGAVEALLGGDHPPLGRVRLRSRGGAPAPGVPRAAEGREGEHNKYV